MTVAVRSLRRRLMLGAAVAIFVALAFAWVAMLWLMERHAEHREAFEMAGEANALVKSISLQGGRLAVVDGPHDPLFSQAASGLYWQVSSRGQFVKSPSLGPEILEEGGGPAPEGQWRIVRRNGPFNRGILVGERTVFPITQGPPVVVRIAQDWESLGLDEFGLELAAFLAGLWVLLSAAAYLQVTLGLRPLSVIQQDLKRLHQNPAARLSGAYPREVQPLGDAINRLAATREADLKRARQRAADLAHSLKTPLAALAAQSRKAREAGAAEAADGLERAIAAVGAALDAELARARIADARTSTIAAEASLLAVADRLISVIERTEKGETVIFETDAPADLRAPVAELDLAEILGALIENAVRHATRRVRISGAVEGSTTVLTVEDDGPGIEAGRTEAALIRGGRLDEAGPGHGLGLAIVRDLVEATHGAIHLDRSSLGGLRIVLEWPRPTDGGPAASA